MTLQHLIFAKTKSSISAYSYRQTGEVSLWYKLASNHLANKLTDALKAYLIAPGSETVFIRR